MKKILLGLVFLFAAIYLLFGDALSMPDLGIPFWSLIFIVGFGFATVQHILRRKWTSAYVFGIITFILLNNQFEWLEVGTGTLILAAILAGMGGNLLLAPKDSKLFIKGKPIEDYIRGRVSTSGASSTNSDTIFGSATRYINGDIGEVGGDLVFASASLYFDNANLPTGYATYSGDAVFSSVKLYLPQDWSVEFRGDRVFSSVKMDNQPSHSDKVLVITGDLVFSSLEVIFI